MSKIALKSNPLGTGTFTIESPNSNTDRTLTLPDVNATLLTDSAGVLNIGSGQLYKDASGNVGIGTTSPNVALELTRSPAVDFRLNGGVVISELQANENAGVGFTGTRSNHPFVFRTNLTERMRIDSAGNVGIGTSSPNAKLTVQDGIRIQPASGKPNEFPLPLNGETKWYSFNVGTSFENIFTIPSNDHTFLMIYRIGAADRTSVRSGMVFVGRSPGAFLDVISGGTGSIQLNGTDVEIKASFGTYGSGVRMSLTRVAP
jgi:hypothetical protein